MAVEDTPTLTPTILKHVKAVFEQQSKDGTLPAGQGFDSFLGHIQNNTQDEASKVEVNLSYPISHYYISTSHNTYLTGNQLWSKSSTDTYKHVLQQACRCVEIDVWDGKSASDSSDSASDNEDKEDVVEKGESEIKKLTQKMKKHFGKVNSRENKTDDNTSSEAQHEATLNDDMLPPTPWHSETTRIEPRVLHGHTATKEISFRTVCEVIREYAFSTSDLPLIVSLEVHCGHDQQQIMVQIMQEYWAPYLVRLPDGFSDATPLPSLESLKRTILIKVKYAPPKKKGRLGGAKTSKHSTTDSEHAGGDASDEEGQMDAEKSGKIIPALSGLGTYVRACHFKSLDQPEAKIPTHVFAVSEKKVISLVEQQQEKLFRHNVNYLMRAYPKGARVSSSNLDPAPFWRQGIQMVALNWQEMNAAMMLNHAMFAGTGGWVAKPECYRSDNYNKFSTYSNFKDITVQLFAAQNLDPEAASLPNAYIKCEIHTESRAEKEDSSIPDGGKSKGGEWKKRSADRRGKDPDFGGEILNFPHVEHMAPELSFLRIKVMDDDAFQKDRLLGWVCFRFDRIPQGLRLLHLKGVDSRTTASSLLVLIKTNSVSKV